MTTTPHTQEPSPEQALEALMLDGDLERLEDQLAEFNLFDVLSVRDKELEHSRIIAWLLNPRESHGLGDYFLRAFLSQAASEARKRRIPAPSAVHVDGWALSDVEVVRERHRIDILLTSETDGFVCLIENKIFSKEWAGQLRSYLETVERDYDELRPFPIFLTPAGGDPMNEADRARYVPFGYERVAGILERTLQTRGNSIGVNAASFLRQYIAALRRHILDTPDNIDKLALQLYNNHRKAIDLIINAKPTRSDEGRETFEAAVDACAPDLRPDFHVKGFWRFYASSLEDAQELKEGKGWTASKRMLLFEFKKPPNVQLYVYIGPGPQPTRERLYNRLSALAQERGAPFRMSKGIRDFWLAYQRPVLSEDDYAPFDPDVAKPKIEQAVREFYERDYWPIVNAVREEFGLPPVAEE